MLAMCVTAYSQQIILQQHDVFPSCQHLLIYEFKNPLNAVVDASWLLATSPLEQSVPEFF